MSQWAQTGQPCPCGKSSDAYSIHVDGHGYCFSCAKPFGGPEISTSIENEEGYTLEYIDRRGITKDTHAFFDVKAKIDKDGKPVAVGYPFGPDSKGQDVYQVKRIDDPPRNLKFRSVGEISEKGGWGPAYFSAGSAKSITIVEGLDDAMACWQLLGKYPVYAVKSSSSALTDVRRDFEYLNTFERIYLCLDSDEPGQAATKKLAAVFDFKKVYHVKLAPYKDATEFAEAGKVKEFKDVWYGAQRFLPEGVKSSFRSLDAALDAAGKNPGHPWPWPKFQYLTDGIKNKCYLFSGLEGIGKTEVFHALEHHLAKTDPDANIGILHLEEELADNLKILAGYELKTQCHLSDSLVSLDEIKKTIRAVAGRDDRLHFYEHIGSDNPDDILALVRFLVAACGCKYVFLDNITVAISGRSEGEATQVLDYLSTQLEMLVKELHFTLFLISHENDNEQTRGSRNISKVADVWIQLKRDTANDSSVIHTRFKKNRGGRGTKPGDDLVYDPSTGVLTHVPEDLPL
jgi:twinkle protein